MAIATFTPQQRLRSLAAVIGTAFGVGAAIAAVVPLLANALQRDGYSATAIGVNAMMFPVAVIAIGPFVPRIIARFGPLRSIYGGLGIAAAAVLLFPAMPDIYAWCVIRFVVGMAAAVHWVASETWMNLIAEDSNRSRIMGVYAAVMSLGFVCGPLIINATGIDGWLPFVAVSIAILVALVPMPLAGNVAPAMPSHKPRGLLHIVAGAPLVMGAALVSGFVDTGLFNQIAVYEAREGFSMETANLSLSVFMAGNFALQMPLGWLADRTGRRGLLLASSAIIAIGAVIYPFVLHAGPILWVLMFLWGGVGFGIYTLGLALMGERFSPANLAAANAAFIMMYEVGSMTGPVVVGGAIDLWARYGLPAVVAVASTLFVVFGLWTGRDR